MKGKNALTLILLLSLALILVVFSSDARTGAAQGLALAQNTIIPSLMPLLIIFYIIIKSSARDVLAKALGFISTGLFNLPKATFPAIFFGMVGGYPTGALLTNELLLNGDIDKKQARRLLRFNMCGGCGFIITAVGSVTFNSVKIGLVLFFANLLAAITVGFILSFTEKRMSTDFYSYSNEIAITDALVGATGSSVSAVLNMTAYIILFSAFNKIIPIPQMLTPLVEITNGICKGADIPLPQISAFLAFGGFCIHFQLLPVISNAQMNYFDFLLYRVFCALLSYCYTKCILFAFPVEKYVFSSNDTKVIEFSSVNITLSILMIIGCFVIVADVYSRSIVHRKKTA